MATVASNIGLFPQLGALFVYPGEGYDAQVQNAAEVLRPDNEEAALALDAFVSSLKRLRRGEREEAYTRAFELSPQCIPYLSVYLFGEDSHKRAELMTGLKSIYENAGRPCSYELPDHLAVILSNADVFPESDWKELTRWCIPGPLKEMVRGLHRAESPYRHLLDAILAVFRQQYPREFGSC